MYCQEFKFNDCIEMFQCYFEVIKFVSSPHPSDVYYGRMKSICYLLASVYTQVGFTISTNVNAIFCMVAINYVLFPFDSDFSSICAEEETQWF